MTPRLFSQNESSFSSHGIGPLKEATRCTVHEELNGSYELSLELPAGSRHFDAVATRALVLAKPNPYDEPQPFRIYRETRPTSLLLSASARHISYDLDGIPVAPYTAANAAQAVQLLKSSSLLPNPFSFGTDMSATREMRVEVPTAARALLGENMPSLLKIYGGELQFDRFSVLLTSRRGADRGVTIAYGKNLVDVNQEKNIGELFTGVLPFYIERADEGENVTIIGDVQNAPGSFGFSRIKPVDLSSEFDETPTVAQLNSAGQAYIEREKIGVPEVSLRVTAIPPGDIRLGDTVRVRFERLGIDATARVIGYTYDVLHDRYLSLDIGTKRETITAAVREAGTDASKLEKGTLPSERIGARSIGGGSLKKNAVSEDELADNSVTVNKIVDGTVISQKIADGAVTGNKVLDAAITYAKLNGNVQIALADIFVSQAVFSGYIYSNGVLQSRNGIVVGSTLFQGRYIGSSLPSGAVESVFVLGAAQ